MQSTLRVRELCSNEVWDYENGYHWFTSSQRVGKFLAHYEIYKKILELPGDIIECGVYKAASAIRWATFRELCESKRSRRLVCFDAYGDFPTSSVRGTDDQLFTEAFTADGGSGLSLDEVKSIFAHKKLDENTLFIKGDVRASIPAWLEKNTHARFSLVHLDMDVYEPTSSALTDLWPRIVRGGIVVIDDYNTVGGATRAIDEFLRDKNIRLQKLGLNHTPAFFEKP